MGWLICNSQLVSQDTYNELFTIIGKKYTPENTNSESVFAVPDLCGRVPVGVDSNAIRLTSNNNLGQFGGEENHTLTINEIPAHSHVVSGQDGTNGSSICMKGGFGGSSRNTSSIGGSGSHNNMQPYLILNYITQCASYFGLKE